jgi:uncharacterized membrane-anchored protein
MTNRTKNRRKIQSWVKSREARAKKGAALYEKHLKKRLERLYRNKIALIDYDTLNYFIGDDVIEAAEKAKATYPDKTFFMVRVGHRAAYKLTSPKNFTKRFLLIEP